MGAGEVHSTHLDWDSYRATSHPPPKSCENLASKWEQQALGEEGGATLVFSGEDFTTRLMNDMDPPLLDLVKTKVNSFIKWDLVRFLRENPNTADTAENIAKYVGRNATEKKATFVVGNC